MLSTVAKISTSYLMLAELLYDYHKIVFPGKHMEGQYICPI